MQILIKALILILFLVVIFFRSAFPSDFLYWITYFFMFVLVFLLWVAMFWVSRKKNKEILGKDPNFDIFAGRVSKNVNDDLMRGRLSIVDKRVVLVQRTKNGFKETWSVPVEDIKEVQLGTVAGVRKGLILILKDDQVSFTCGKIFKRKDDFYKALGWQ